MTVGLVVVCQWISISISMMLVVPWWYVGHDSGAGGGGGKTGC